MRPRCAAPGWHHRFGSSRPTSRKRAATMARDISLMGYDNTALAALGHISLTTIHQPRRQIGEMAMTAVLRRIERPGLKAQRHVLAPKLVVRATTAKWPGRRAR